MIKEKLWKEAIRFCKILFFYQNPNFLILSTSIIFSENVSDLISILWKFKEN